MSPDLPQSSCDVDAPCDVDAVYEEILQAFDRAGSNRHLELAAALILCLCQRIQDEEMIRDAMTAALASLPPSRE